MEKIQQTITQRITHFLETSGVGEVPFSLETPASGHGDLATNVALVASARLRQSPRQVAELVVAVFAKDPIPGLAAVEIAGPGFINFRFEDALLSDELRRACTEGPNYGRGTSLAGERHLVEYTDPNPFKMFHIGHLMTNAIGESIARLTESQGATVVRMTYGGDVGPHVARTLWGLLHSPTPIPDETAPEGERIHALGDAYVRGTAAAEESPEAKAEIDAINRRIYEGDPGLRALYDMGKRWSIDHFHAIYRRLGTSFDVEKWESEIAEDGKREVEKAIGIVFAESAGAIVYEGDPALGLHTRVFLNRDRIPTYEAKEVGITSWKFAQFPDIVRSLVVTANEQDDYFRVVTAALETLHPEWRGKLMHKGHGLMRFAEGKMSSRKGNVIGGVDLLDLLVADLSEKHGGDPVWEEVKDMVAIGAIKYAILRQEIGKDIIFDPDQALSVEGDSGPYLQYTHARLSSLLRKGEEKGVVPDLARLTGDGALPRIIARFPLVVRRAQEGDAPQLLATYAIQLCREFNSYYGATVVLDGTPEEGARLALVAAVRVVLQNALFLLGIPAPERM